MSAVSRDNVYPLPKVIYLFGHRQGFGKDQCCDILEGILKEKGITFHRGMFAKMLKKHCADRYGLDESLMGDQEYKLSQVPHAGGKTVREILIAEGRFARSIWEDTWVWQTYNELFMSGAEVGFVSDWRYPNESNMDKMFDMFVKKNMNKNNDCIFVKPKIIRVQVYRSEGVFKNDGADAELPDDFDFYDYNIMNTETPYWMENLTEQVKDIFSRTYKG